MPNSFIAVLVGSIRQLIAAATFTENSMAAHHTGSDTGILGFMSISRMADRSELPFCDCHKNTSMGRR